MAPALFDLGQADQSARQWLGFELAVMEIAIFFPDEICPAIVTKNPPRDILPGFALIRQSKACWHGQAGAA